MKQRNHIRACVTAWLSRCSLTIACFSAWIASAHAAAVEVSWSAVTKNADGTQLQDLAGYKVHVSGATLPQPVTVDVGNVLKYRVPNLTAGATYVFSVSAYDSSGNASDKSSGVTIVIPGSGGNATPTPGSGTSTPRPNGTATPGNGTPQPTPGGTPPANGSPTPVGTTAPRAPGAIPLDFDGDGGSDLAMTKLVKAKAAIVLSVQMSATGEIVTKQATGNGMAVLPGDYNGDGTWEPAFLRDARNGKEVVFSDKKQKPFPISPSVNAVLSGCRFRAGDSSSDKTTPLLLFTGKTVRIQNPVTRAWRKVRLPIAGRLTDASCTVSNGQGLILLTTAIPMKGARGGGKETLLFMAVDADGKKVFERVVPYKSAKILVHDFDGDGDDDPGLVSVESRESMTATFYPADDPAHQGTRVSLPWYSAAASVYIKDPGGTRPAIFAQTRGGIETLKGPLFDRSLVMSKPLHGMTLLSGVRFLALTNGGRK